MYHFFQIQSEIQVVRRTDAQTDVRTDGQTDGRTERRGTPYFGDATKNLESSKMEQYPSPPIMLMRILEESRAETQTHDTCDYLSIMRKNVTTDEET